VLLQPLPSRRSPSWREERSLRLGKQTNILTPAFS
jgi:hypothetical protein